MTLPVQPPILPTPPATYSQEYMNLLLRNLETYFQALNTHGPLQATTLTLGSQGTFISSGNGSPEGALIARVGSIYTRLDGGSGTTLYVKETGTGNTGWVSQTGAGSTANATSPVLTTITATAGQTVFSVVYTPGLLSVYGDGFALTPTTDFTASDGTSMTLASGAVAGTEFMFVAYQAASVPTLTQSVIVATAAQTSFSTTYTVGSLVVYLNGFALTPTVDYAATTGTTVVLTSGALVGDELLFASYTIAVIPAMTQTEITASAAQTSFALTYTPGLLLVFANGFALMPNIDYTATNGVSVDLATGAVSGTEFLFITL